MIASRLQCVFNLRGRNVLFMLEMAVLCIPTVVFHGVSVDLMSLLVVWWSSFARKHEGLSREHPLLPHHFTSGPRLPNSSLVAQVPRQRMLLSSLRLFVERRIL